MFHPSAACSAPVTGCHLAVLHAAPASLLLKWDELAGAVTGKPVSVNLKDGSVVEGVANRVEGSALVLVSNKKKSQISIARETIAGLRVTKMRKRGGIAGTAVGALRGIVAGGVLVFRGSDQGFPFANSASESSRGSRRIWGIDWNSGRRIFPWPTPGLP